MADTQDFLPYKDTQLGWWMLHALQDYAAARCCLSNGLFSGFLLAQQAIEKLLKAHLRIAVDGGVKVKTNVLDHVTASHDLIAYAREVDRAYPSLAIEANHTDILTKLSQRFEGKYPDSKVSRISGTTAERYNLDQIAVQLFERIDVQTKLKVKLGIYPSLWHLVDPLQAKTHESHWVLFDNMQLEARLPMMLQEIKELFPSKA